MECVTDAGFQGVEFAYRVTDEETDVKEVSAVPAETGLDVAGVHVPIDSLENDLTDTVQFYDSLGCTDIVVPWLDEEYFTSERGVADAVDRLAWIEAELNSFGIELHYHNHRHEFIDINGRTGFDTFIDESSIGIELDLGLALLGVTIQSNGSKRSNVDLHSSI